MTGAQFSQASSTAALKDALEQGLSRHFNKPCRLTGLERRPFAHRTSCAMEELDVRVDDGQRLLILFKNLSRDAFLESARRAKPTFVHDPSREIHTYQGVLAQDRLGTATCYESVVQPERGRYWLFLEKISGVELYQVSELSTWQNVARWLAQMHTRCRENITKLRASASWLIYDARFHGVWLRRAFQFASQNAEMVFLRRLAHRYDDVIERLTALPVTFLHGEFYASNILVQTETDRVCPVDWEMAAIGPGLIDLAALIAGNWTEEEKKILALAYHAASASPSAPKEFLEHLDLCRLHVAVQWLGWSTDWSPPPSQAQNWLGEAVAMCDKLGL